LADDLGYMDTGFQGSTFYETPNLDRLATEGVIFTDAHSNGANCAPTRASLMSGMYTPRHGVYTVGTSERGSSTHRKLIPTPNTVTLRGDIITVAECLKAAGYVTASMGKWHLGDGPLGPCGQGFDLNVGGNTAGSPRSYFSPYHNKDLPDGPAGEYLTDRLTDEAVKFIGAHKDRPFFLYLPHYAVHSPFQAKQQMEAKYKTKPPFRGQKNPTYAAMIESLDQGVGRILKALDDAGVAGRTMVVFFSDNGGVGRITDNTPLRGYKGMPYEGGHRVPLTVRWPGRVKPGTRCDATVVGLDFYPTLLEIAGAAPPAGQPMDGASLVPLLTGEGAFDRGRAVYWHLPIYLEEGGKGWRCTPCSVIRKGDLKLIEFFEDNHVELYDLKDDLGESKDLAAAQPDKAKELLADLKAWQKSVNAPIPTQLNPGYNPSARAGKSGRKGAAAAEE
ncbi:MAG TPA: sulfatase, partial [Planctomycetota bacterium]|nr:sulfatase [Planctomycetota bacterium]